MDATAGWSAPSVQNGISISTSAVPNNPSKATRGEGTCASSAMTLFAVLGDPTYRTQWDPMIETSRVLRVVDRLTRIAHSLFKAPWPMSKREMIIVGRGQREDDGSFFSFATSVPYPDLPATSGVIRASLLYYGVRFYPLTPSTCRFRYVACSDPLGYLPKAVVNLAATIQPQTIARLDRLLQSKPQLRLDAVKALQEKLKKEGFEVGETPEQSAPPGEQQLQTPKSGASTQEQEGQEEEEEEEEDGEERKTEAEQRTAEAAAADGEASAEDVAA